MHSPEEGVTSYPGNLPGTVDSPVPTTAFGLEMS